MKTCGIVLACLAALVFLSAIVIRLSLTRPQRHDFNPAPAMNFVGLVMLFTAAALIFLSH